MVGEVWTVVDSAPVAVALGSSLVHAAATRPNTAASTTTARIPNRSEKPFRNDLSRIRISRLYDRTTNTKCEPSRPEIAARLPSDAVMILFQRPRALSHVPPEPPEHRILWS